MADPNRQFSASLYWVGHVATLAVVFATFAALFVLYLVRSGNPQFWSPVKLPNQLWLSTAFLVAASFCVEASRWALRREQWNEYASWLIRTSVAGVAFLITQILCWRMILAQNAIAHDANSGLLYLLTGAHAVHVLAGMSALGYLIWRVWHPWASRAPHRRNSITFMLATYWHAMLFIWIAMYAMLAAHAR